MAVQFSEPADVLMFRKYYSLFLQVYGEKGSSDWLACILLQGWDLSLHLVSYELQKREKFGTFFFWHQNTLSSHREHHLLFQFF